MKDLELDVELNRVCQLHRENRFDEAIEICNSILAANCKSASAWHLRGAILHQKGAHNEALGAIECAIQLDYRQAVFFNNHGVVLQALGRWEHASIAFQTAVKIRSNYIEAWSNLGHAQQELGQFDESCAALRRALDLDPNHHDSLLRLGRVLTLADRSGQAIEYFERALTLIPNQPEVLSDLAGCLLHVKRARDAELVYRHMLAVTPDDALVHFKLATALLEQELAEEARTEFGTASRLAPENACWDLRTLSISPSAFGSGEAIDAYRAELSDRLDRLLEDPPALSLPQLMEIGYVPPFALAFQGRFDRPLKEKFAALCRKWIQPLSPKGSGGKPRIGFVVTPGHEGLFVRCSGGIIERLSSERLDVVLICAQRSVETLRREIRRLDLQIATIPEDLAEAAASIEQLRCDLVYFWEVGSDPLNYLLPFFKVAPVQVTSWATQVTSGVAEIDYYLSGELIEIPTAEEHYTEKLIRLPGLLTYQRRQPQPSASKASFGLSEDRAVYLCPQTVLKLHPDQDELFAGVLRADPQGVLVLKAGRNPRPMDIVRARMQQAMPDVFDRIVFLPFQSYADYCRLVSVADVVLDPCHFSAGSSSYDMWSFNQPIVTLPGRFNIGRYTQACYRRMEFTELVAGSKEEYVRIATRVGQDSDHRRAVRKELQERTPALFEVDSSAGELERVLLELASARSAGR